MTDRTASVGNGTSYQSTNSTVDSGFADRTPDERRQVRLLPPENTAYDAPSNQRAQWLDGNENTVGSPPPVRVRRAQAEPQYQSNKESWGDFQCRHYQWRMGGGTDCTKNPPPKNEGKQPPRSLSDAVYDVVLGTIFGGPVDGMVKFPMELPLRPAIAKVLNPFEPAGRSGKSSASPRPGQKKGASSASPSSSSSSSPTSSRPASPTGTASSPSTPATPSTPLRTGSPMDTLSPQSQPTSPMDTLPPPSQATSPMDTLSPDFPGARGVDSVGSSSSTTADAAVRSKPPRKADDTHPRNPFLKRADKPHGMRINKKGMLEKTSFATVYRVARVADRDAILAEGFVPSTQFEGMPKMIRGKALIVSETLEGAHAFGNGEFGAGHYDVYAIDARGLKGASLKDNIEYNTAFLAKILGRTVEALKNLPPREIAEGALEFREAHLDAKAGRTDRIHLVERGVASPDRTSSSDGEGGSDAQRRSAVRR